MSSIIEHTSRFTAINEYGEFRVIDEYTRFNIVRPLSGPAEKHPGSRMLRHGQDHVNELDDGTLEIVRTGERLKRV